ncbi:hypothetical protein [Aurantiacibacter gilvus]|uniref:Transferrin-binding protein B C-lobe/N-lobe beta barrel domain-containing protein n=1 Tax=Aurantiacibacter gilvus TaxID=3139141 RepID=A0ABU9IFK5_9SPHN
MLRKYALFVGVAALGALVTSCGGDDTANPTPTPTDSGTGTPTPTPTSSQVDFSVTEAFTAESSNANAAFAYFTPDGSMDEVFNGAARLNGTAGIQFLTDPESVTFAFPDLTDNVVFDATDFASVTATERNYARAGEKLTMLLPFAHIMQVNYELTQDFTRDTTDGTLRGTRAAFFFNRITTEDDITADIQYDGTVQVVGGDPGTTASDAISAPDATISVLAANDAISGTIQIFEDVNGTPELATTLVFQRTTNDTGAVTGGVFGSTGVVSGILTDTDNNFAGNFAGALAGPDREELLLIFSVTGNEDDDDDRRFVGRFIGQQ